MYRVDFGFCEPAICSNLMSALACVRRKLRVTRASAYADSNLAVIKCDDGRYCYASSADASADETGTKAFAVISIV